MPWSSNQYTVFFFFCNWATVRRRRLSWRTGEETDGPNGQRFSIGLDCRLSSTHHFGPAHLPLSQRSRRLPPSLYQTREAAQRRRAAGPKSAAGAQTPTGNSGLQLPTASRCSHGRPPRRHPALQPPSHLLLPSASPLPALHRHSAARFRGCCVQASIPLPRAAASDGDVFWEEPDDGSGSDYEDDGPEQRRASRFPSSSPSSRLEAARQQEQDLRRGINYPHKFTSLLLLGLLFERPSALLLCVLLHLNLPLKFLFG